MKYHFKVHKEGNGYWAECVELLGCITEADSIDELQKNMEEALNLYIEEPENSKELAALNPYMLPRILSKSHLIHRLHLHLWCAITESSMGLPNNKLQKKWVLIKSIVINV